MKKLILSLVAVILSSTAIAQTNSMPPEKPPVPLEDTTSEFPAEQTLPEPTVVSPEEIKLSSRTLRGLTRYSGTIHFSTLSTWLPLKYGIAAGYNYDMNWTVEAEYTTKSYSAGILGVDFGGITDRRYGIQTRWHPGSNSFNFIFGLYRSEFTAELGNDMLSRTGAPSGTVLGFKSFGPLFGLSNHWQWRYGLTLGVDWIAMYIPAFGGTVEDDALKAITNQSDRSSLDKVISAVRNIPQFDVLKLNLGYTF